MLHPLPLPLSSCLGCIPPLIGLPSLRFYAVGSSLFLLSLCFCLCSLFYRDDVLCWLLLARPFLYAFHAHLRFPVDLVWFRLSCDHGWIRSGSVNVRKQQQQQQLLFLGVFLPVIYRRGVRYSRCPSLWLLPLSLFDLIAIPLSLLLHFIPLSLSLLCLPIWAVLHHLYMYMVAFLALRILYVVALVCFCFCSLFFFPF